MRNSAHTLAKLATPFGEQDVLRIASVSHPEYVGRVASFFRQIGARGLLMHGTEGEAYANPQRCPQIHYIVDGEQQVLLERPAQDETPELPAAKDAETTARWTERCLAGRWLFRWRSSARLPAVCWPPVKLTAWNKGWRVYAARKSLGYTGTSRILAERMVMQQALDYFNQLNQDYLDVHRAKEDLFWQNYMGTGGDEVSARFSAAESAYKRFIGEPRRLAEIRRLLAGLEILPQDAQRDALQHGLNGWLRFFDCNAIEDAQAQTLLDQIISAEADLYTRRKANPVSHLNAAGQRVNASLGELLTNQATNENEDCRRSSQDALRELEQWLLHNGLPELISLRNRFARQMGFRNYFDYKVNKTERMTPEQLFAILDRFEQQTREANSRSLQQLAAEKGAQALEPWNLRYASAGDVTRQLDPYFPFAQSLERWINSFKRLHIGFRGAQMDLDLLVRPGKYENGFMHGPVPPFIQQGKWLPARINFYQPGAAGSGRQRRSWPEHPVPRGRPRRALCQYLSERTLLLSGVSADVNGLCRNPVDVLRQPAGRRRLAETLCEERRRRTGAGCAD